MAMANYAYDIRSGAKRGATGKPFTAIVHIGIGGSDLGPRVVWDALRPLDPQIDLRFVANIDPRDMAEALTGLDPETTLVIVVSKTFTTQETLANADVAKAWLKKALPDGGYDQTFEQHLIGVTAAPGRAEEWGCGRIFGFEDWVGGRYSLWSPVSLSCVIALGYDVFEAMLAGAAAMDDHFVSAPLEKNAPVLLALAQIWNVDGLHRPARTVAPYAHALRRLPAFLQQLEMESNGKRVHRDSSPVTRQTCPVVFGEPGTNGQHAFFQQIHQGPQVVPAEFVIVAKTHEDAPESPLWSNALAQGQALMLGKTTAQARAELLASGADAAEADRLAAHKTFPGNRPSTAIVMERLTPETLGALLALYEHKTFAEGVIWDINSFDQWGVELGKVLAKAILKDVAAGGPSTDLDPSTAGLLTRLLG
jgi:glucose-6-phosphate isomerase